MTWFLDHLDEVLARGAQHAYLAGVPLVLGLLLALPLGWLARRYRFLYAPFTAGFGLLYTIPSLALFTLLIPFTGLGLLAAEIALVSYTILILVRNIVAGLDGVPREVRDAADGMGYTRRRRLWQVELPLALPTIVAGLRIASRRRRPATCRRVPDARRTPASRALSWPRTCQKTRKWCAAAPQTFPARRWRRRSGLRCTRGPRPPAAAGS